MSLFRTRVLMTGSAGLMFCLGLGCTFAPAEMLNAMGGVPQPYLVLTMQVVGALYLGFASLNWMAKDNLIGGIYSRPVAVGNLLHFTVATAALVRGWLASRSDGRLLLLATAYFLFALWFGLVTFASPGTRTPVKTDTM